MKININGITREMTADEVAELERLNASMPAPEPTPDERMTEIETALIELAALLPDGMI